MPWRCSRGCCSLSVLQHAVSLLWTLIVPDSNHMKYCRLQISVFLVRVWSIDGDQLSFQSPVNKTLPGGFRSIIMTSEGTMDYHHHWHHKLPLDWYFLDQIASCLISTSDDLLIIDSILWWAAGWKPSSVFVSRKGASEHCGQWESSPTSSGGPTSWPIRSCSSAHLSGYLLQHFLSIVSYWRHLFWRVSAFILLLCENKLDFFFFEF